jgi:hypothetical protein
VRFAARPFTFLGERLPGACGARHLGLAAELAFDADFARDRSHLIANVASVSVMLLMVPASAAISPLAFHRELLLQVARRHRRSPPWRCRAPAR